MRMMKNIVEPKMDAVALGSRPITYSHLLQKHATSKGSSLHQHYLASTVILPFTTPARASTYKRCRRPLPRSREGPPTLRKVSS
jgi:hypothetical protein